MRTLTLAAALLAAIAGAITPARAADYCNPFDYNNDFVLTGADYNDEIETDDQVVRLGYCADPAAWQAYYDLLQLDLEASEWTTTPSCVDSSITRTMNAARTLDLLYYDNLALAGTPGYHWLVDYVSPRMGDQSLETECTVDGTINATNMEPGGSIDLLYRFFWILDVWSRTGTLVHEAVHEDVGHIDDALCPAHASCDSMFLAYNAQSLQISVAADMIDGYQSDPSAGTPVVDNFGNGMCGWRPRQSQAARLDSLLETWNRFHFRFPTDTVDVAYFPEQMAHEMVDDTNYLYAYGDRVYLTDVEHQARWPCDDVCDPAEWFAKCDEDAQPDNAEINLANGWACIQANLALDGGVTPAQHAAALGAFASSVDACIPGYAPEVVDAHCESLFVFTWASLIEQYWNLPDLPGEFDAGAAIADCQQAFCETQFDWSWVTPAENACYAWSDPSPAPGCLNEICGDLSSIAAVMGPTSPPYFKALLCRREFLEHQGEADAYLTPDEMGSGCAAGYTECLYDEWLAAPAGTCTLASPSSGTQLPALGGLPSVATPVAVDDWIATNAGFQASECVVAYEACLSLWGMAAQAAGELAAEQYVAPQDIVGPPVDGLAGLGRGLLPGSRGTVELLKIAAAHAPGMTPAEARAVLRASPEARFAMTDLLGRQTYLAMFGTAGEADIFGEAALAAAGRPRVIVAPDATPAQRAILARAADIAAVRARVEATAAQAALDLARAPLATVVAPALIALRNARTPAEVHAVLDSLGVPAL